MMLFYYISENNKKSLITIQGIEFNQIAQWRESLGLSHYNKLPSVAVRKPTAPLFYFKIGLF